MSSFSCPECACKDVRVIRTFGQDIELPESTITLIRRFRRCRHCGYQFTTTEQQDSKNAKIVNGKLQPDTLPVEDNPEPAPNDQLKSESPQPTQPLDDPQPNTQTTQTISETFLETPLAELELYGVPEVVIRRLEEHLGAIFVKHIQTCEESDIKSIPGISNKRYEVLIKGLLAMQRDTS